MYFDQYVKRGKGSIYMKSRTAYSQGISSHPAQRYKIDRFARILVPPSSASTKGSIVVFEPLLYDEKGTPPDFNGLFLQDKSTGRNPTDMVYDIEWDEDAFIGLEGQKTELTSTAHGFPSGYQPNLFSQDVSATNGPQLITTSLGSSDGCSASVLNEITLYLDEPVDFDFTHWVSYNSLYDAGNKRWKTPAELENEGVCLSSIAGNEAFTECNHFPNSGGQSDSDGNGQAVWAGGAAASVADDGIPPHINIACPPDHIDRTDDTTGIGSCTQVQLASGLVCQPKPVDGFGNFLHCFLVTFWRLEKSLKN